MSSVFTKFLVLPLAVMAQVFSTIPEAPVRLTLLYPSSSRHDTATKFSAPTAMSVARSGHIYVVDDGNSRIVKLGMANREYVSSLSSPNCFRSATQFQT